MKGVIWTFILVLLLLQHDDGTAPRVLLATEALLVIVGSYFMLGRATPTRFWSPLALFLLVLSVFHLGLIGNILTGVDPSFPRQSDYVWYDGSLGQAALSLCLIAIATYTAAAFWAIAAIQPREQKPVDNAANQFLSAVFSTVGAFVLMASVALWFFLTIGQLGIGGLVGSYQSFLAMTSTTGINLTYPAIGVGLGLTLSSPARGLQRAAIAFFVVFAVLGFFLGLRGEVLFPVAVGASVLATRRKMPKMGLVIVGILVLLTLINAGKQIRQAGLGESGLSLNDATPLGALAELGSTLRVVATVLEWHEVRDEPFQAGATYAVLILRQVETLTGSVPPPAGADYRLFNVEIINRAGGIGGSVIAEAYHNFALPGVLMVMALLGVIFARFSTARLAPVSLAVFVVIAVPLFNHVRNSFVPVLPMVILGLALVFVVFLSTRASTARARESAGTSLDG